MANLALEVDQALLGLLNVQAMIDLAKGGVWNTVVPPNVVYPYCMFQEIDEQTEHTFDGRFANALYQVKAVSKARSPKEAMDIDTQIDSLLEDASMTLSSFSLKFCRRESGIRNPELVGSEIWHHIGGIYRIIADET
jgi:hypothetical protein